MYKRLISQSITQPPADVLNFLLRASQMGSGGGGGSGGGSSDDKSRMKVQDLSSVCAVGMRWEKHLPDSSEGPKRLSLAESKELLRCEELLPLQALIAYRQQAVTETLLRAYERSIKDADSTSTSGTGIGAGVGAGAGAGASTATVTVTGSTKDATTSKSNPMAMAMAMGAMAHVDGVMNGSPHKHATEMKKSVASTFKKLFSYKKEKDKDKENNRDREVLEVARSLDDEGIGTNIGTSGELNVVDKKESRSNRRNNPFVKMKDLFRSNRDLTLDIYPPMPATATPSMRTEEAMDDVSLEYLASELLNDVINNNNNSCSSNNNNNNNNNMSSRETRAAQGQGQGPGKEAEGESFFPLRLRLSACVSVTLSDVVPLVMVQVACGGDITATSMTDLRVDCYVQELLIEDLITVTPLKGTLLSFASTAPTPNHTSAAPAVPYAAGAEDMKRDRDSYMSKVRVLYASSGLTSSSLRVSCQPIEIAINVLCLERLSELAAARVARLLKVVATFGENDYLRKTAEWGAEGVITAQTAANMAGQVAEAIVGDGMEICVEVRSNKVYLPHCSSRDEGCFVLDLGRAVLNGGYSMDSGLTLRLDVTDLCAGIMLPLPLPLPLPLNHRPALTPTSSSSCSSSLPPRPRSKCSAGTGTGTQTMIEYLLNPVDAYLTFLTPGEERGEVKEKERGEVKEKERGEVKEKERGEVKEKERGEVKEKERGEVKEKERGEVKEKERGEVKEKERGEVKEKERGDVKEKERGDVKEKEEREKGPIIALKSPSSSSTSSSSSSALHSSGVCVTSDDALPIIDSRLGSKLLIELKLRSGLQIVLTPPKLVQIVQYSRIFISFVWTVNNVFCLHLGSPAKCIADEKLAEGLHYLNNVLNPTMKSGHARDNKGNSSSNSNSNSNSNSKGKNSTTSKVSPNVSIDKKAVKGKGISKGKRKGKSNGSLSELFSKMVQNISGVGTGTGTGSSSRTDKEEVGIGRGAGAEATRAGELSTNCICICM